MSTSIHKKSSGWRCALIGSCILLLLHISPVGASNQLIASPSLDSGSPKPQQVDVGNETHQLRKPTKTSRNNQTERLLLRSEDNGARPYTILSSQQIEERLFQDYQVNYPDWIQITTSQQAYGLPRAGGANDCPYDSREAGCSNLIVTIQDFRLHPDGSPCSNRLPEVFWSGALHGNERVGPTAVTEAMGLLLASAQCESTPLSTIARDRCRNRLANQGILAAQQRWLARLVSSRRLVVMPMANSLGYYRNDREEGTVDPNRDFPYDRLSPTTCMQTIAARSLNEVFRDHMFQMSLTFHAGIELIGYEWGAPSYFGFLSPDETAQNNIAGAYSRYGGSFGTTPPYIFGDMNSVIYFVNGGMEDWAYAGSWDEERVLPCEPTTFGGYPRDRTMYNNSTLRAYNMLVETSNAKTPIEASLGSTWDPLNEDTTSNGHVPRNIRVAILAMELVEPYVDIINMRSSADSDEVHSETVPSGRCFAGNVSVRAATAERLLVEWIVGGGFSVDDTSLYYGRRTDEVWSSFFNDDGSCEQPPKDWNPSSYSGVQVARMETSNTGTTSWTSEGARPSSDDLVRGGPMFVGSIDVSNYKADDEIVVVARVLMDQSWLSSVPSTARPSGIGPQAHVVRARTDADWYHESGGKVIDGRLYWYSKPWLVKVNTIPTVPPTSVPSIAPSSRPTYPPTHLRSPTPTVASSSLPTNLPTHHASSFPTISPSSIPTFLPPHHPSSLPISDLTNLSSTIPSEKQSNLPTLLPTDSSSSQYPVLTMSDSLSPSSTTHSLAPIYRSSGEDIFGGNPPVSGIAIPPTPSASTFMTLPMNSSPCFIALGSLLLADLIL